MSGTPQMPSKSPALLVAAQGRQRMEGKRQKKKAKEGLCKKKTGNSKAMDKWGGETKLHVSPDKESQKVFLVLDEKFRALTHLPWLSQYRHSHVKQQLLHLPMPHVFIQNMTAT